jgi:hypothetical protein
MFGKQCLVVLLMVIMLLPAGCGEKKRELGECSETGLAISLNHTQGTLVEVVVQVQGTEALAAPPVLLFVVPDAARGLEGVWSYNGLVEGAMAVSRTSEQWKTVMDAVASRCAGSGADCVPETAWVSMCEGKLDNGHYRATLDLFGIPEANWNHCMAWIMSTQKDCYSLTSTSLGRKP